MTPQIRLPLFVLGVSCVLFACGGSGEPPSTNTAATAIDPCALVTTAEASQALGVTVGPPERPTEANHPPRMVTCRYTGPRGQGLAVMSVLVQMSDTADQARRGFQSAKDQFPGITVVSGLGDDAFAMANQLNVLQGTVYLNITGDFDVTVAKTLAQTALTRLR
jgi:hypothetical protein